MQDNPVQLYCSIPCIVDEGFINAATGKRLAVAPEDVIERFVKHGICLKKVRHRSCGNRLAAAVLLSFVNALWISG